MLQEMYRTWPVDYSRLDRPRAVIHTKASRLGLTNRRHVAPLFAEVTDQQWSYLAGFFDGEGTAWVNQGQRASTKQPYHQLVATVCNTDDKVMDFIEATWPGGNTQLRPPKDGERRLPLRVYRWVRTPVVIEILQGMLPHLITKKEAAMRVLSYASAKTRFSALT